jgi:predicted signal transduction protein with EAL and GGDEF domain
VENCEAEASYLGLLLIELTGLRHVNHKHSTATGDQLLALAWQRLQTIKKMPFTVFRVGGNCFAFILPGLQNPSLIALALNKISLVLGETAQLDGVPVDPGPVIGVAVNRHGLSSAEQMLLEAESSLRDAREGSAPFRKTDRQQVADAQVELESRFSSALSGNEFQMFYQPKVDLHTGDVSGVEALLRWLPENGEPVDPETVVKLAERTGQTFTLTRWALNAAVRQAAAWQKQGLVLNVAVNIPADLIHNPELITVVRDALAIWGVPRDRLTLEITESAVISDMEAGVHNLAAIKEYGVQLSIDDFGTGYSSLSYFKQIPAHELKIDRSFVQRMLEDQQDQHLVRIIINLARLFQLKVVAEGIEDEETCVVLQKLGCHFGQGFHIARPMDAKGLVAWLTERQAAA